MSKELPSCSGCEHEYECVNMVCFYELLEREKKKIRADAIDEFLELIEKRITESNHGLYLIDAMSFAEHLKEQKND